MDDIAAGDQDTALCDDNAAANDKCTYGQTDRCSDGQTDGTYRRPSHTTDHHHHAEFHPI